MNPRFFRLTLITLAAFTLIVASASAAQATPAGSSRPDSGPKRIRFARGATSAVVSGDLAAGVTARYILRAGAGQLMDAILSAPAGASLSVTSLNGKALVPQTGSSIGFRGYLPRTSDYILTVKAGSQAGSYSLNVSIPARIAFQAGTTSASLNGHLQPHQSLDYILRAQAEQILEINVSPENSVQLINYGVDGTVLRSGMGEGSSFRGLLPVSQDYIVTARAGDKPVDFTLNAIIPQRITFQPGAISGQVKGSLSPNSSQYYVLRALKNQTLQVNVTHSNDVQLIIYGADGSVLKSGMGEGISFSGKLPGTQDYILVLRAAAKRAAYTLQVTIQ